MKFLIWLFAISLFALESPNDPKYAWMDALVKENFKTFTKGVSLKRLMATEIADPNISRIKVIGNQVTIVKGKESAGSLMVRKLAKTYGLPDLDLLYLSSPCLKQTLGAGAPILLLSMVIPLHYIMYNRCIQ